MDQFDAMFGETYSPDQFQNDDEVENFAIKTITEETYKALNPTTTADMESVFSLSLNDANISSLLTGGVVDTREALKPLMNEAYEIADDIGEEGMDKLRESVLDFRKWCNKKNADERKSWDGKNDEMATIPMTQGKYKDSVTRVYNTHKMR